MCGSLVLFWLMEKHALFEIGTTNIRLTLANVAEGEHFYIYKTLNEYIHINEHIEADGLIKTGKIHECIVLLKMYKKICEADGVTNYTAIAANNLRDAKNFKSFIDTAGAAIGMEFRIMTPEDEVAAKYASVINTLDVPKGIILDVSSYATRIIHYNRRVILDSATIPFGSVSLFTRAENMPLIAVDLFKKELQEIAPFLQNLDPETTIVGVSDTFASFGRIARKMKKYPLDIDHNYTTDGETFYQVFDFIKSLDMDKKQKLKGISSHAATTILCGMCIVDAVLQFSGLKNLVVGCSYRNTGIMFNIAVPYTLERPVTDVLGYSLEIIAANAGLNKSYSEQHYSLALLLFKQLKVLHKLPRGYAKVLRIASYLYHIGKNISADHFERNNYHAILAAPLMGASHKEIVLAAFSASIKKWEEFNLAEWIKYKDMVTDEDLEAVRKIAIITAMADALNLRNCNVVKDITCDILGDSVVLKLVCETDQRAPKVDVKAAEIEIFYAKKYSTEFQKAFRKQLEIL